MKESFEMNEELKKGKVKNLDNLEFVLSIVFIIIGSSNLCVLNVVIQSDILFKIISMVSSAIIIIVGLYVQDYIEKKKKSIN